MGIKVEFNPDLALRNISELKNGNRKLEECIPEDIGAGKEYKFLKKGQRNYWMEGELPLLETKGNAVLSTPFASIKIVEATHFIDQEGGICTRGKYNVIEVFNDDKIHFNGFAKI